MSTLSVPLLLPTVDTTAHNQCAALRGTLEKAGADLRWEVLPTLGFLPRLAESTAPLPLQSLGMFSASPAILFQTPSLSSCAQVIMPAGGRGAEEDFGSEQSQDWERNTCTRPDVHARELQKAKQRPDTTQRRFKIASHTQQSKTGKTQFHFPVPIQKGAKPSGDIGCFRREPEMSAAEPEPSLKPRRPPRGPQKTPPRRLDSLRKLNSVPGLECDAQG